MTITYTEVRKLKRRELREKSLQWLRKARRDFKKAWDKQCEVEAALEEQCWSVADEDDEFKTLNYLKQLNRILKVINTIYNKKY